MSDQKQSFAALFNCMDGRCQKDAIALVEDAFGVEFADSITEPGINAILAGSEHPLLKSPERREFVEGWIYDKAVVSAKNHGATQAVIIGHCKCAGNPVELESHKTHLRLAKEKVSSWELFEDVRTAVFNDDWELTLLD